VAEFYYVRPDEMVTLYAGVSATVATDYVDDWLCDGRPGRPIRATGTTFSATITPLSAGEVGLVAVAHHNLTAAVTFGGDITATVTPGTVPPNGIPLNPYAAITPVAGVDNITISTTGNTSTVVIGEVIAGRMRTLTRPVYSQDETGMEDFTRTMALDLSSMPPYDGGLYRRTWSGKFIVATATRDLITAWYQAQRAGTRPSLIVPEPSVNDAWLGFLRPPSFSPAGGIYWSVSMSFEEIPRVRW
jgi:hypothetical protein